MLDTRLYLNEDRAADRDRRRQAGVPDTVVLRAEPELAAESVRQLGPQLRHGWVTSDEGYGKDPAFLAEREERGEHWGMTRRQGSAGCATTTGRR